MPPVQQRAEVRGAAGQSVVGGNRQHDRTFAAQVALDGHGGGRVRDAVRQLRQRVARTRRDNEHIEHRLWADGLGGNDAVDGSGSGECGQLFAPVGCSAETGVERACVVGQDGRDGIAALGQRLNDRQDLGERAERPGQHKTDA